MSEPNSENPAPAAASSSAPLRLRHRLPKALPNIANLNAASRVHRAETPAAEKAAPSVTAAAAENANVTVPATEPAKPTAAAVDVTKQRKPLISTTNSSEGTGGGGASGGGGLSNPATPTPLALLQASNPNSPAVASAHHSSPAAVLRNHSIDLAVTGHSPGLGILAASSSSGAPGLSYKQYANIHGFNSVPMSPAAASNFGPCTPGPIMPASVYNAKFSNEHIMNIIKHKTLQKLKKIESDVRQDVAKPFANHPSTAVSNFPLSSF